MTQSVYSRNPVKRGKESMKNVLANLGGRKDPQMLPVPFMERNRNTAV